MIRFSRRSIALLFAFAGLAASGAAMAAEPSLAKAVEEATKDGRPILAVAALSTCPRCTSFVSRLKSDASLQPLLAKYVRVIVDVQGPDYQALAQKKSLGGGLPILYVLRADGELIVATNNGGAAPLPDMLNQGLAKSGRILSKADAARTAAAVAKAKTALEKNDLAQAGSALVAVGSTESFAAPLLEAKHLLDQLNERARRDIEACQVALAKSGDAFTTIVKVAEALRTYEKLPAQKRALSDLQNQVRRKVGGSVLLEQADAVARARGFRAIDRTDAAARAYQQVIDTYPDTAAATLAKQELASVTPR